MIVVGVEHRDLLVVVADSHVAALVVVDGVVVLRLGAVDKLDCGRTLSMISHVVAVVGSKHQSWNASSMMGACGWE